MNPLTLKTNTQRGSTLVGFIFGLLLGLAVALVVAIYVTKMPTPFSQKDTPTRAAGQDAAETQKNKDWDPNAPLYGGKKAGADKAEPAEAEPKPESPAPSPAPKASEPPAKPKVDAASKVDPKSADPLGDLAKVKTKPSAPKTPENTADNAEPFVYFVQVGAYRTLEDAQTQRAKTVMLGLETKVSEREQGGRAVFRVRAGPMDKTQAEAVRAKMQAAQIDAAVVRVQR